MTFKAFAEKWLRDYAEHRVRESTYRRYSDIIRLHLNPHFGEFNLTEINPRLIEEYLSAKGKWTRLKPASILKHFRLLKSLLKRAVIWGYLAQNPADRVDAPPAEEEEMDYLTIEELQAFLKAVDKKYYPFFLTAALTGMRLGELLALKWSDINWGNGPHPRSTAGLFGTLSGTKIQSL
ncbi:MAG: site-specific integrase [Actinomycetota bacterium]|nr:site-specific integrase [Actinomycetota bacterium]